MGSIPLWFIMVIMQFQCLKYAGLAAIIVEYAAFAYLLSASGQPLSLSSTISDFGAYGATSLIFSIAFSLAGVLFGLFGLWLSRTLPLHRNFTIALLIGIAAQVGLSWFPVEGGGQVFHYIFATIVMIVMPLLVYYFSLATNNLKIRRLAQGVVIIEVLALVLLPLSVSWHLSLLAEALTFIGFQLWVLLATFKHRN